MGKKSKEQPKDLSVPEDVKRCGFEAEIKFREMIMDGVSRSMAEMLACKQPPGARIGPYGAIKPGVGPTPEGDRRIKALDNPG